MKQKIWLFFLVMLFAGNAYGGDLKEIRNRTRDLINEAEGETKKHWPDSTLNWYINDAQSFIQGLTNVVQAETTYTLVAGTINYGLPGDFYLYEGAIFKKNVAVTSPQWEEPRYLPHRQKKDIGLGYNPQRGPVQICSIWGDSIMFWPTPRTTDKVTLYFVSRPDTLNADSSTLRVPEPMETIIPFYVASHCWYKTKNYTLAMAAMDFFMKSLETMTIRYETAMKSEFPMAQDKTSPVTVDGP